MFLMIYGVTSFTGHVIFAGIWYYVLCVCESVFAVVCLVQKDSFPYYYPVLKCSSQAESHVASFCTEEKNESR